TERYQSGPLGQGWSSPWFTALQVDTDGTVTISGPGKAGRRFAPDSRAAGTYLAVNGDTARLRQLDSGGFELTETTGTTTRFDAAGRLSSVEDVNGSQITAQYTSGRLTSLTHSSGAFLTLAYNAFGLVDSVTDSTGRVTTYGYDPTHTYLMTVSDAEG